MLLAVDESFLHIMETDLYFMKKAGIENATFTVLYNFGDLFHV